jgi:hypothetical protein
MTGLIDASSWRPQDSYRATAQRLANEGAAIGTRARQSGKQKAGLYPPRIAGQSVDIQALYYRFVDHEERLSIE